MLLHGTTLVAFSVSFGSSFQHPTILEEEDWTADAPLPPDEPPISRETVDIKPDVKNLSPLANLDLIYRPCGDDRCGAVFTPRVNCASDRMKALNNIPPVEIKVEVDPMDDLADIYKRLLLEDKKAIAGAENMKETSVDNSAVSEQAKETAPEEETSYAANYNEEEAIPLDHWAAVYYYEEKEKIGKIFYAIDPYFNVNGKTVRTTDRRKMSLSSAPNSFSRPVSSIIRNQLGEGIDVVMKNGQVKLQCKAECAVFVQCPQRAHIRQDPPNCVYRLSSRDKANQELVIFDEEYFRLVLDKCADSECEDNYFLLHNHCITRISFVKGFGEAYPRKEITQTPCWIEIQFVYKLKDLDSALRSGYFG
ncbi:unnamed protein product [Caenorhabditis auriculariae]|uniref:MH2 domain-containing protein n=1 Tax=Caenorhabditis auriculariae TaxID=2777116 RepID=A0A8S1HGE2_9PELO|nr:unnamed protein product [Caenorhabditis auriculariae]